MEVQEVTGGSTTEHPAKVAPEPQKSPRRPSRTRSAQKPAEPPAVVAEDEQQVRVDALLNDLLPLPDPTPEEVERGVVRVREATTGIDRLDVPTVRVSPDQIAFVSAEAAESLLALCEYDKQRPTSPSTVQRYTDLMKAGEFGLSLGWIGWVGAKPYLINMKHRLQAIVQAAKDQPDITFPSIIVETIHETKHEVDLIYGNQDRGKDRTPSDYLRSIGGESLGDLEQAEGNRLASAACFLMTGFQNASPTSARPAMQDILFRVKLAAVYRKVAADYFAVIRHAKGDLKKALLRAPVVAVAVAIMEEQPEKGAAFFKRIAEFDNLAKESPEWWMATNVLLPGKYTSRENLRLTRAIAVCWNAYYDDRTIPDLRLPSRMTEHPIELRGTSYTQKVVYIPEKLGEYRAALGTAPQPRKRLQYKRAGASAGE